MSVSDAIKRDHSTAAYGNARLVVDRLLHAAHFLWYLDGTEWMWWSMAEHYKLVNRSLSLKSPEPADQEGLRELLKSLRHWNRTEDGRDRQMKRPGSYKWAKVKRGLLTDIDAHILQMYNIFSTYVHPTYRGHNPSPPGLEYVLETVKVSLCATILICAASMAYADSEFSVDDSLLSVGRILSKRSSSLFFIRDDAIAKAPVNTWLCWDGDRLAKAILGITDTANEVVES